MLVRRGAPPWTTSSAFGSGYVSTAFTDEMTLEEKGQLRDQLHSTEEALSALARELVVDGVPLTVAGVACAVLALLLQAVASIATFNGVS